MAEMSEIRRAVREVLAERLRELDVESVDIVRATDFDESEVLRVKVVYGTDSTEPDPRHLSALVRFLRERLESIQERRFPIVRLMSSEDAKSLLSEPA